MKCIHRKLNIDIVTPTVSVYAFLSQSINGKRKLGLRFFRSVCTSYIELNLTLQFNVYIVKDLSLHNLHILPKRFQ